MKHETKCFRFQVSGFMSLFDFLKRKSAKSRQSRHLGGPATISPKASLGGKDEPAKKVEAVSVAKNKKISGFSYDAVRQPHISEKATYLSEKNQYIFKVLPGFNKNEIKNAVEGLYGVDVLSVRMVKIPAKKRRIGRTQGFKKGYKKAIVKIKEGQKIEIL